MLKIVRERLRQGHRTMPLRGDSSVMPPRFRGAPLISGSDCRADCTRCSSVCPQEAISGVASGIKIDLGRCVFCGDCAVSCPDRVLGFTNDFRMATDSRDDLFFSGGSIRLAGTLDNRRLSLFRHSFKLRQVSAGGCNGCEADVNVLGTIVFDLGRFGIQMVASPRHADGILVTGPVTENMRQALMETYEATPAPRAVIAVGSCAISGGPFRDSGQVYNGVSGLLPVDLYVPGCPPHPLTVTDGLLRLLGRVSRR